MQQLQLLLSTSNYFPFVASSLTRQGPTPGCAPVRPWCASPSVSSQPAFASAGRSPWSRSFKCPDTRNHVLRPKGTSHPVLLPVPTEPELGSSAHASVPCSEDALAELAGGCDDCCDGCCRGGGDGRGGAGRRPLHPPFRSWNSFSFFRDYFVAADAVAAADAAADADQLPKLARQGQMVRALELLAPRALSGLPARSPCSVARSLF